jgi:1-acyl-sn-glycerol-3-phosphate acyltransferase
MSASVRQPVPAPPALEPLPREAPPGGGGETTVRQQIRVRLEAARALEQLPPERYGFRIDTAVRLFWVTATMYRRYFRTECYGIERLPAGPVLLVANHGSHVLSWDGANILSACLLEADPPRLVHGMAEHALMRLPVLGRVAQRIGAVDGTREACIALLRGGAAVLAFPEGTKALSRRFSQRYRLSPFGHGFVHVALAAQAPIVPVAVIGSEEEAPLLAQPQWLRRLIGTPTAPITPTLFVPLPVRYRLHFGTAFYPSGPPTAERIARHVEYVRDMLAALIARGLAARRHVFT